MNHDEILDQTIGDLTEMQREERDLEYLPKMQHYLSNLRLICKPLPDIDTNLDYLQEEMARVIKWLHRVERLKENQCQKITNTQENTDIISTSPLMTENAYASLIYCKPPLTMNRLWKEEPFRAAK